VILNLQRLEEEEEEEEEIRAITSRVQLGKRNLWS
jgi:hypothetical protein